MALRDNFNMWKIAACIRLGTILSNYFWVEYKMNWKRFVISDDLRLRESQEQDKSSYIVYQAIVTPLGSQIKQYTASNETGLQNQREHLIILTKYKAVHSTGVSENNSSSGMLFELTERIGSILLNVH